MQLLPSVATLSIGFPDLLDMYPRTEKMTNPAQKLVMQLMELVASASLPNLQSNSCTNRGLNRFRASEHAALKQLRPIALNHAHMNSVKHIDGHRRHVFEIC